ncbi:hypothetical protein ABI59_15870 [Acidobacteria bacterium Mor1]|nr:hypothetical protein ABI59_15870 [Acidobacteria bacterium Mor1]
MKLSEQLGRRKLLVVTGKGGVGKSALTAVLGRSLAGPGKRVLLLEVDPRENLHELFDAPPSDGRLVRLDDNLELQNLKPHGVLDEVVREQIGIPGLTKRVMQSPVYRHFVDGAPGLREMAVLGYAWRRLKGYGSWSEQKPDLVILDAPATGHGLSLLNAPSLVADVIPKGPFGEMARELRRFAGPGGECGVVVVTLAEEMPAQEAIELRRAMGRKLALAPDLLCVNALYPELPANPPDDPLHRLWRTRRGINDNELARLREQWREPLCTLPMLPRERGPQLVDGLMPFLRDALAENA